MLVKGACFEFSGDNDELGISGVLSGNGKL